MKPLATAGRPALTAPVRPNVSIGVAYRRRLLAMIEAMHRDVLDHVERGWRKTPPRMAMDVLPASAFRDMMDRLRNHWVDRFEEFGKAAGKRFAEGSMAQTDRAFAATLRDMGFTIQFKLTPVIRDVLSATIGEQVGLIRGIAERHMADAQGMVMRSITAGYDVGRLRNDLQTTFGMTKKRAALIARDQNSKAVASITRARQIEVGITRAIWLHSLGGKVPRPEHIAMNGKPYDIAKGAFLEGVWTWPGKEVNCRCVSKSIISGLEP